MVKNMRSFAVFPLQSEPIFVPLNFWILELGFWIYDTPPADQFNK
jgi:hypothetical protein